MSGLCVFRCRHPPWGGVGERITADDPTADYLCMCDTSYATRDSFGNPSCVPFRARRCEKETRGSVYSRRGGGSAKGVGSSAYRGA